MKYGAMKLDMVCPECGKNGFASKTVGELTNSLKCYECGKWTVANEWRYAPGYQPLGVVTAADYIGDDGFCRVTLKIRRQELPSITMGSITRLAVLAVKIPDAVRVETKTVKRWAIVNTNDGQIYNMGTKEAMDSACSSDAKNKLKVIELSGQYEATIKQADKCNHSWTTNVFENGGKVLQRCEKCGAGRSADGIWSMIPQEVK